MDPGNADFGRHAEILRRMATADERDGACAALPETLAQAITDPFTDLWRAAVRLTLTPAVAVDDAEDSAWYAYGTEGAPSCLLRLDARLCLRIVGAMLGAPHQDDAAQAPGLAERMIASAFAAALAAISSKEIRGDTQALAPVGQGRTLSDAAPRGFAARTGFMADVFIGNDALAGRVLYLDTVEPTFAPAAEEPHVDLALWKRRLQRAVGAIRAPLAASFMAGSKTYLEISDWRYGMVLPLDAADMPLLLHSACKRTHLIAAGRLEANNGARAFLAGSPAPQATTKQG